MEKDGVMETRVEQKITIQSDGDPIDHDRALADAIQEATMMNPDLTGIYSGSLLCRQLFIIIPFSSGKDWNPTTVFVTVKPWLWTTDPSITHLTARLHLLGTLFDDCKMFALWQPCLQNGQQQSWLRIQLLFDQSVLFTRIFIFLFILTRHFFSRSLFIHHIGLLHTAIFCNQVLLDPPKYDCIRGKNYYFCMH